jgi:PAS domain S-box-containing protein
MTGNDALKDGLARLKAEFAERLPGRLAEIESANNAFASASGDARVAALKNLAGLAHSLAGSAGTFGYPDLGSAARALSDRSEKILESPASLDTGAVAQIVDLTNRLMASAGKATPPSPGTEPEIRRAGSSGRKHLALAAYVPAALTALGILLAGLYADRLNERRFIEDRRTDVFDKLSAIRSRLEGHIHVNTSLVKMLATVIATEPDMTQERFEALAGPLLTASWQLRHISAAPDLVIRYIFPRQGNEGALGLDIGNHPAQREAVFRARDIGEMVLEGPIDLVQGGRGFIGRFPVFVDREPGQGKAFWGLISAIIDEERLYEAAGLRDIVLPLDIAIRGKDGLGAKGDLFFGRAEVFGSDPKVASVRLPDGTWQMAAIPKGGWPVRADDAWSLRLVFGLGGLLIVLSVAFAITSLRKRTESVEALKASEERFRDLAEISSDWIWESGPDGRFTYFSDSFVRQTGFPKEHLLGKTREDFAVRVPGDEEFWEHYRRTIAERRPFRDMRYRYRRPDGTVGWVSIRGRPVFDADGKFRGYRGAVREITQRMKEEDELREARGAADAANRAKSEFLSNMSHELRTPLNAILGFGQLLKYNPKEPLTKAQTVNVDIILKAGQHLLDLIAEILDLAKIEAGKVSLSIENVSICALFDEVRTMIAPAAEKSRITLEIASPEPDILIRADHTRAKQALLNLVSNAVKYNFEGGRVTVKATEVPGSRIRVSVADTGPGIPPDKQSELFQPFNRLGAEATAIEGTGIGLALTKKLVEMMDGAIGFESETGVGSTFWVEWPLSAGQDKPAQKSQLARFPGLPAETAIPFPAGTILYVEDNPENLRLVELILKPIDGVTLLTADNAELGLLIAANRRPDMIVMDINLPGMDGFQALEKLQNDPRTSSIPVVALSANATTRDIEKGVQSGFFRYLTKPVDVGQLLSTVREVLGSRP